MSESGLRDKTLFITGGSRGIGLALALRAAHDGARVAIAAKTVEPHPKLPGTIFTAAEAVEAAGGKALPIAVDIRFENQIAAAFERAAAVFGGIDILVNNASAIQLMSTELTEAKRFDLMHQINVRGTFLCSKYALPYLKRSNNPHVLTLAPPVSLRPQWFARHTAYTTSKFGMAMVTYGLAAEFKEQGIAFNCLWPKTMIKTAALAMIPGINFAQSRLPEIVAEAAHAILTRPAKECSGNFFIDEEVLLEEGTRDFAKYAVDPRLEPMKDLFLD